MDREVKTTLNEILELISVADFYSYDSPILMDAFAEMINYTLSDDEIEAYSLSILEDGEYGHEDYLEVKATLIEFRANYCNVNND